MKTLKCICYIEIVETPIYLLCSSLLHTKQQRKRVGMHIYCISSAIQLYLIILKTQLNFRSFKSNQIALLCVGVFFVVAVRICDSTEDKKNP